MPRNYRAVPCSKCGRRALAPLDATDWLCTLCKVEMTQNTGKYTLRYDPLEDNGGLAVGMEFGAEDMYAMIIAKGFTEGTILESRNGLFQYRAGDLVPVSKDYLTGVKNERV